MLQKKSLAVCLALLPLIFIGIFLALFQARHIRSYTFDQGAIIRGDVAAKRIALVFTGHEFSDGELISHLIEDGH